jgi:hypothetical protein
LDQLTQKSLQPFLLNPYFPQGQAVEVGGLEVEIRNLREKHILGNSSSHVIEQYTRRGSCPVSWDMGRGCL